MTKFYAVKKGKTTGIFTDWATCQKAVSGFSGAMFKSFTDKRDAQNYLNSAAKSYLDAKDVNYNNYAVIIHTDGGCRNHGNVKNGHILETDPAAWACLIQDKKHNKNYVASNGEFGKSNNYMEIRGVMRALQIAKKLELNNCKILFVCDSQYALRASDNDWLKEKAQKNFDMINGAIWQHIYDLLPDFNHITWAWTHGHEGESGNEFVDAKLNHTMDSMMLQQAKKHTEVKD